MTTKPFDFPKTWGKLGNWPGTIGPQSALALLQEIAKLPKGSSIVEFRFDGGRTSAVVGWGCKAGGHVGIVTGAPSQDGMSEVWFNRLLMLFELGGFLHREYAPKPYAASMLVVNPGYVVPEEWRAALKGGGIIFYVADGRCEIKEAAPHIEASKELKLVGEESVRETGGGRKVRAVADKSDEVAEALEENGKSKLLAEPEALAGLADGPNGPLPEGVGGNGAAPDSQALATDAGPVARDDGDGKGHRGPSEGSEEVVPEKGGV